MRRAPGVSLTDYERRIEFCAGEWTEEDTVRAVAWLGRWGVPKWEASTSGLVLDSCLPKIARENSYHPLQEYLNSLRWDANRRIDTMLSRYFGAPNTNTQGDITVLDGIRRRQSVRAGVPGGLHDCSRGRAEKGKTRALEALFGTEYFSETGFNIDDKDSVSASAASGCMYLTNSPNGKKGCRECQNFLTRKVDNIRPSYGRRNRDYPRRCVFARRQTRASTSRTRPGIEDFAGPLRRSNRPRGYHRRPRPAVARR